MRNCRKQNDDGNVVQSKKNVAAFQVKEEKLLLQEKILPNSANDEGVKAVKAGEGKKNAKDDSTDCLFRAAFFFKIFIFSE